MPWNSRVYDSNGIISTPTAPAPPASEQPYGFGRSGDGDNSTGITGGRAKSVFYVTNTNSSGSGSYLQALADASSAGGNVVFEVAGEINKREGVSSSLHRITGRDVTVWGETAPGQIGVHGRYAKLDMSAGNVIVRHVAHRLDDNSDGSATVQDSVIAINNSGTGATADNILFANCSFSGGSDENMTVRAVAGSENYTNVSVYRCLFSWPIRDAGRVEGHNKNPLFNGMVNLSFVENICACGEGRPAFQMYGDMVCSNNLIYLWSGPLMNLSNFGYGTDIGVIFENNKMIPDQPHVARYNNIARTFPATNPGIWLEIRSNVTSTSEVYIAGNDTGGAGLTNNASSSVLVGSAPTLSDATFTSDYASRKLTSAQLDSSWMNGVGANPTHRNAWDQSALDAINNLDGMYIDDVEETSNDGRIPEGFPTLTETSHTQLYGQSLSARLESEIGAANFNDVQPGFTNKTKLEYYLEQFQAGVAP